MYYITLCNTTTTRKPVLHKNCTATLCPGEHQGECTRRWVQAPPRCQRTIRVKIPDDAKDDGYEPHRKRRWVRAPPQRAEDARFGFNPRRCRDDGYQPHRTAESQRLRFKSLTRLKTLFKRLFEAPGFLKRLNRADVQFTQHSHTSLRYKRRRFGQVLAA